MLIRYFDRIAREADDGGAGGGDGGAKPKSYDEAYVAGLRREAQGYRERLTAVEGEFTAHREKSTADLAAAQAASVEATGRATAATRDAALKIAAKDAGIVDLDGLKLLDTSAVKVGADGVVEIPKEFFADAKKAKPYLFAQTGADTGNTSHTGTTPAPKVPAPKQATEMTAEEYTAARAAIIAAR